MVFASVKFDALAFGVFTLRGGKLSAGIACSGDSDEAAEAVDVEEEVGWWIGGEYGVGGFWVDGVLLLVPKVGELEAFDEPVWLGEGVGCDISSNVTIKWTLSFKKCFISGLIIVSPRCVFNFGVLCGGLENRSRKRVARVYRFAHEKSNS